MNITQQSFHSVSRTVRLVVVAVCFVTITFTLTSQMVFADADDGPHVNYETVVFIANDGHQFTRYVTTRSQRPNYKVLFDKSETLANYLYISPNNYVFDDTKPRTNSLIFDQGSYALISQGDLVNLADPDKSLVSVDSEGIYHLRTWDGSKQANGHYGYWNTPDNYQSFAIAWVIPDNFFVLDYHSNRQGEWVKRGNTLAFFAQNVNDLTFEISYKPLTQNTYAQVKDQFKDNKLVAVEQHQEEVRVVLESEILFGSGSVTLSDEGQAVLRELAADLMQNPDLEIVVEGHTDNVTIKGALAEIYPTNWELSAKRALNVVHELSSAGISPQRLQAAAYGPFRPRVENSSDENRQMNRRIELLLRPAEHTP